MSTSHTIDFAALTLQDALDLGILIEEDARERYGEFVDQLEAHYTEEAAAFFRNMVRNEGKHRDWLTKRRTSLFGAAPSRVDASMLVEIEAPEFSEADIFMTLRQALDVALKAEVRAYRFFADALKHVRDPQVRELFTELRDEEVEHQQMVQREIDKLPPGPEPDTRGQADEPVGH
ncbi:MAG: ferritin family protein [Lentisphaerae bacterium]|nr:ferritin family protein [Lentisphaerota bacterium]